jgi:mercuric ion binding protein
MFKKICLLLSFVLMPFTVHNVYAASTEKVKAENSIKTVTFNMQNMTCAMCEFTIKKALEDVKGVQKVSVDSTKKTATATFDTKKTSIKDLIKATTDAGYPATVRKK